nr:hypothetical protein [Bacteroides acidifaciens]
MDALLINTSVPIVRRKKVADSRLSPGVSAGRSETAPGIAAVTRSAWATVPQGYTSHRVLLPLLYSASEGAATGAEYKTGVASAIVRKGFHRIGCRL